jgi:arylsulfatase A-like enzyme
MKIENYIIKELLKGKFFRIQFVLSLCVIAISCRNTTKTTKPNIIFIMADDHAYQAISAYDNKLIETPNIDKIAQQGVLFQRAFVTNSICGPSRATILTGKYSHINGFKDNDNYLFDGEQQTLPKILQENGYETAIVGKWHLGSVPTGFDFWNILPDQGHYYQPSFIKMGRDTVYSGYVTDIITDQAIDWIKQNKSKPFFMMLHHKAPHRNWMPPLDYLTEFNDVRFPLPENFYDDYNNRIAMQKQKLTIRNQMSVTYDNKVPCDTCAEDAVNHWVRDEWKREFGRLTPEQKEIWEEKMKVEVEEFSKIKTKDDLLKWQFQRYMEDYLRCIKSVDDNVGRVLDFLRKSGLDKNTIVVYTSDQGFYLGEHGLYDKRFMYEESFRTPLIISSPFTKNRGIQNAELVMNLDFAPTILDFAGIKAPIDMQGVSMKPLLFGEKATNWRKEVYYHYYEKSFGMAKHYGIRTEKYKLIHFYDPIDCWELYDLQVDSLEMNNLITDQNMQYVVEDLKISLKELQEKYKDDMNSEIFPQK